MLTSKHREGSKPRRTIRVHGPHRSPQRPIAAQRIVDTLRDETAVTHAELRIALKKELHEYVSGTVELQNNFKRTGQLVND